MADLQSQYLKDYRGGSAWDQIYGQIPGSQYYDATGQVHNKGFGEKFTDYVFSPAAKHPKSKYLVTASMHLSTPFQSRGTIIEWLSGL